MIGTDRNTQLTGNAFVPLKGDGHPRPIDIQGLGGADGDTGRAMGASILMPFDILSKRLDLYPYFTEILKTCLDICPLSGNLQDESPLLIGGDPRPHNIDFQIIILDQPRYYRLVDEMLWITEDDSPFLHGAPPFRVKNLKGLRTASLEV